MAKAVPLRAAQVKAAKWLQKPIPKWKEVDKALAVLKRQLPGFGREVTLIKIAALDALYGTNLRDNRVDMANHVHRLMKQENRPCGPKLIEKLAIAKPGGKRHVSFASKFAHFFISTEDFPIYDARAIAMVSYHSGVPKKRMTTGKDRYGAFVREFRKLQDGLPVSCSSTRDLDRYLWIADVCRKLQKNPNAKVNKEAKAQLLLCDPAVKAHVKVLLG